MTPPTSVVQGQGKSEYLPASFHGLAVVYLVFRQTHNAIGSVRDDPVVLPQHLRGRDRAADLNAHRPEHRLL